MAQIQIEERRRGLGWLWAIIALIVIALAVWYLTAGNEVDEPVTTTPVAPTIIDAPAAPEPAAAA